MIETIKSKARSTPHYRARIRIKNVIDKSKTFKYYDDAARWYHQQMADIDNFTKAHGYGASKATLAQAIDKYIREHKIKSLSLPILNWWKAKLGNKLLTAITTTDIVACRSELMTTEYQIGHQFRPRQAATINKYVIILSGLMTTAMKEWQIISSNPCQQIKKLKEPKGRTRYLTHDEIKLLLDACQKSKMAYLYPIVVIALSTGARRSEILKLKWKDVMFDEHRLIFEDTKNGDTRSVPLCGNAYSMLAQMKNESGKIHDFDLVFQGRIKGKVFDFKKAWKTALKTAGIQDFRFHDLRHTAATYLLRTGIGLIPLSEILGHHTMDMVKRYAHVMTDYKQKFVENMNQSMFQ